MKNIGLYACFGLFFLLFPALTTAQQQGLPDGRTMRYPAVPLIAHDPYFSIWSVSDKLTDDWPKHWTGAVNALAGMVRVDGTTYRIMGPSPRAVPPMPQRSVDVTPTRTTYTFDTAGVRIVLTFLTPLLPHDLNVLSRPISYITWETVSSDGKSHDVSLYFDHTAELVVNSSDQKVVWTRNRAAGMTILRMGSQEQRVLEKSGDDLRIDWGYSSLAIPAGIVSQDVFGSHAVVRKAFSTTGELPSSDDLRMPRPAGDEWPVAAVAMPLGSVGSNTVRRHILIGYDDLYSIEYFDRKLRPYWHRGGIEWADLLETAEKEYPVLEQRCVQFDIALIAALRQAGGDKYAQIASLAYRQCLAAQKLAVDMDGTALLFPKENFSNGCISTVDVLYPASPMLLFLNTDLLRASLTPVFQYAESDRWRFNFAPHDLGTYPLANGQVYGGGERTEENQMPVEESGNMILMVAAMAKVDGNADYALKHWSPLSKWAKYLREKGSDPENQLCTDDFAGHLAHNANLSIKAILSLGAYAQLCEMTGKKSEGREYRKLAEQFAAEWAKRAGDGDHYRLAFDSPGTWSQKYNLVWDKILGLKLFPQEIAEKEIAYYLTKQNQYGLPLDNRKEYTKLDWIFWTATMANSGKDFESLTAPVFDFLNATPDRVPMNDWYWTNNAKMVGFQARSVVGGVYCKMLADFPVWKQWASGTAK